MLASGGIFENGKRVKLYDEYVNFFNPDNFDCKFDTPVKNRLKRVKAGNADSLGFVPTELYRPIFGDSATLLDTRGANALCHSLRFIRNDGTLSDLKWTADAPTAQNFNFSDHMVLNDQGESNFAYTCDCSGYFSAGISVSSGGGFLGIGKVDVQGSATKATSESKSLFIIGGIMRSALHQAYRSAGIFKIQDSVHISTQISVLKSILNVLPEKINKSNQIYFSSDYRAIFASNQAERKFSGKANLDVNSGVSFNFAEVAGRIQGEATVGRSIKTSLYNTYIFSENSVGTEDEITVQSIEAKIAALEIKLNSL